jgi:hypothetical protein
MRQQHPPAGTVFLLCLNCDRGEWRRVGNRGEIEPSCRHCGGAVEQRYPLTLALTIEDRSLLKTIAEWERVKTADAAHNAIHREFRRAATNRAARGKPLPQWAADWLQNNQEKPI